MDRESSDLSELQHLGANLLRARIAQGLTQEGLARKSGLSQAQVSLFEAGRRISSLEQLVCLALSLDAPLQRLISGTDRPGTELKDLAVELRGLGAADLWVADATVPGAARCAEETIC